MVSFLCAFIVIAVVWTLLFFNIENEFYNYIFIFIVIILGDISHFSTIGPNGSKNCQERFQLYFHESLVRRRSALFDQTAK